MLSLVLAGMIVHATPAPQHLPVVEVRAPKATLFLQVASTRREQRIGLMSVSALPAHTGMIFVLHQDDAVWLWMKNTLVPLDMVFVAPNGTVRNVDRRVRVVSEGTPDHKIPREYGFAKYVIELPASEARADGIVRGVRLENLAAASPAPATPAPQHLPAMTLNAPKAQLTLQIATTEPERERGLMSVTKLAPHTGMVFVFPQDMPIEFWMKDTLVPLDMVFVARNGTVRSVASDVPVVPEDTPDDRIPRRTGTAMYVIELPAGEAAKDGIVAGTSLAGLTVVRTAQ